MCRKNVSLFGETHTLYQLGGNGHFKCAGRGDGGGGGWGRLVRIDEIMNGDRLLLLPY